MNKFFELIQIALGSKQSYSDPPSADEWQEIFSESQRQALCGVAFCGIERLPECQRPPKSLMLKWYMIVAKLEEKNRHMNVRSVQVCNRFRQDGFLGCILKGQGNSVLYPSPLRRQCGDIDIWLLPEEESGNPNTNWNKSRDKILHYVLKLFPNESVRFHHVEFPALKDAAIEVHYIPMYMQNPFGHRNLLKFFRENKDEEFSNIVEMPENAGRLCIPTARFNAVYQLTHIFIHFIIEGIGLRHFVDYFYVMKNLKQEDHAYVVKELRRINLYGFSKSVMYVLKEVLGLEDEYLISPPDEKRGKVLVSEILEGGNFGKYGTKYWKEGAGFMSKNWEKLKRNMHFLSSYPSEIFFEPFSRIFRTYYCKMVKKRALKKLNTD